jgi:hypothetical protein
MAIPSASTTASRATGLPGWPSEATIVGLRMSVFNGGSQNP